MDYISNKEPQVQEMLKELGINSIEELFSDIPPSLMLKPPSHDDGIAEYEGLKMMEALGEKNRYSRFDSYLGAGAYPHQIPSLVPSITSRGEFLTSYTPYQAECSQGNLQALFEYQSAFCTLTGLEVSNGSLYDGASAAAESLLMAFRIHKERKVAYVSPNIHPHVKAVIELYFKGREEKILFEESVSEEAAALLLSYPDFFGEVIDPSPLFEEAKKVGAIPILYANPLIYGLFKNGKDVGAEVCVGDGQPLGLGLNYGGPYVGYMTSLKKYVRQMPGRIVGKTVDSKGREAYVLTLQAREQHIRREKATSNICTNQALAALTTLITMAWYGKEGLRELALANYQRAHYLHEKLLKTKLFSPFSKNEFFNEFTLKCNANMDKVLAHFQSENILPGLNLERLDHQMKGHLLINVTEIKSKEQLDRYIAVAQSFEI